MGFYTDIVVVSQKEARRVARHDAPAQKWPGCEAKNLNEVNFASLYEILLGEAREIDFPVIVGSEAVCVVRFPADYVELLAGLDAKRIAKAARQWIQTEELKGLWEPGDIQHLQQFLQHVSLLAQKAREEALWLVLRTSG